MLFSFGIRLVWYYRLWSFQGRDKELDIILPIKEIYIFLELEWNGDKSKKTEPIKLLIKDVKILSKCGLLSDKFLNLPLILDNRYYHIPFREQ